ncbi:hypothetical protein C8F04DRAFT_1406954 [Mycena alexandri]|uniref:SWIM-type domain-containing protein n=1 Tax=Mycena alexandri TaxID=1745969 RepID=A0AAD6RX46_9AGAR|nr:hypothetical protein C8F04DRAFT_1406954 [Mycena alexandri]
MSRPRGDHIRRVYTQDPPNPCQCPDFEKNGGACKHIRGCLLLLGTLRAQNIPLPAIPIPDSLTDAHALQTKTAISRAETSAPSLDRPTVRAAAAVADLLQEHKSASDDEDGKDSPDPENDSDSDIDTDASSDSDDDSDGEEDPGGAAAAGNFAALGEQALARTVYELRRWGRDLETWRST